MYKLLKNQCKSTPDIIPMQTVIRLSDNTYIPFDEANTSYQEYLEWVAEGNTPEEAE